MICECSTQYAFQTSQPPPQNPSNLSRFVTTKDPQSGFDELVNPGPRSVVRAGSMMAESLKGWSDGFIGQESKGADRQGPCYWPDLSTFPRVSSSSAHQRHHSRSASPFETQKCVYSVCLCPCGWLDGPIIILTSRHFPPVTHLNEAPKTVVAVYVCHYLIHCSFTIFFSSCFASHLQPQSFAI